MSALFLSYAHDDSDIANRLANDLLDEKYAVWIDNLNLPGGSQWETSLFQAIEECDYFILLWSANIEGSSFSKQELDRALAKGKKVIPLLVSGDPNRIWHEVKPFQYIDFSTYGDGLDKLKRQIPLPTGVLPPPDVKTLIKQGDMTFNSASRLYRSQLSYGMGDQDAVGLLIERSENGIQSFLVGRRAARLEKPQQIQVFLNFSGNISNDRFEDYLDYASYAHPNLFTVLVRGPIATTSKGLQYVLPDKKLIWEKAVQIAWRTIGKVGTDQIPLHLYLNAPVAMGTGFGVGEHFRREVCIYHTNFTPLTPKDRYFLVYRFDGR